MRKLLIVILLFTSVLNATDYYVSSSGGNDSNAGTSTETAWKTIAKVRKGTYVAGDGIYFKRGDIFQGEFTKTLNGSAGNPITIGAYGEGAKPIFYGDLSVTTWTACPGYDSVYVTYNTEFTNDAGATWQDSLGTWVSMRRYTAYAFKADTRAQALEAIKAWPWGVICGVYGSDSIYCKSWDGNTPDVHALTDNTIYGSYITIENIDFRHYWTGLNINQGSGVTVQYNKFQNMMGTAIMFYKAKESLSQYNSIDSVNYTSIYSYQSARTKFYKDTVKNVKSNILDIIRTGTEQCGLGAQQDTSVVFDGCYFENVVDYGVDTYMNVNDTIRYCTFVNVKGGMQVYNGSWTIHDNTITLNGDGHGIRGLTYGTGTTTIYNNTISNLTTGYGLQSSGGGTATIEYTNNTVEGTNASGYFCFYPASGVTSTSNSFCGLGKWRQVTTDYATLELFQATGYESGSDYSVTCEESADIVVSSCTAFGIVTIGNTSTHSFTLSGDNLSPDADNLTVTALDGFTVSLSEGSGFTTPLSVPYTSGALATTTIYVKFTPTEAKEYSGNIVCSGGTADSENVAVSGTGTAPPAEGGLYAPVLR